MANRALLLTLLALFWFSGPVFGESAADTATQYFDVLKRKDYSTAATYLHPDALAEFREMMGFLSEIPPDARASVYSQLFGPDATVDSVASLSDTEYFAAFFAAVMSLAEAAGEVDFGAMEILGEVTEGEDTVHLVIRNRASVGEIEVEGLEVVSLRKYEGDWKALLSGKIKGLPAQLRQAFSHGQ